MASLDQIARIKYDPKRCGNNAEGIRLLNLELMLRPPAKGEINKRINSVLFSGKARKAAESRSK